MTSTLAFHELAQRILVIPSKHHQRIIAIDGGGGAGKTTLAKCLHRAIPDSYILTIDAFYRPASLRTPVAVADGTNHNFDWDRFRVSVLEAVQNNDEVSYQRYQRYQRGSDSLSNEMIRIPRDTTIIVEGVWSMQEAFAPFYDYRIWLQAPASVRLQRGIRRDGEEMRKVWEEEFIPIDESYRERQSPNLSADCVVDSAASDFMKDVIVRL